MHPSPTTERNVKKYDALDDAKLSLDSALKEGELSAESFKEERVKGVEVLRSMYNQCVVDDQPRSENRAKVQSMKDYKPPYDQRLLDKLGRGNQFNVNFGEGAAIVNESANSYLDIFTNPSSLINLPIKKEFGILTERERWSEIISNEFTKMTRMWDESQFKFIELVDQFILHGVAFGSFRAGHDWRWNVGGLAEYKVPSRSKATSSGIEVLFSEEVISATKLYSYIKDKDFAEKHGWNVDAVMAAISWSAKAKEQTYNDQSPEAVEEKIKAHDFEYASPVGPLKIIHCWVTEYSGKVSQYIFPDKRSTDSKKQGEAKENFLYKKCDAYESMKEAIHVFPFFTGNNGNIHTIRGLGHIIFPQVQASNLMQCSMLDSARESMATTYVTNSETNLDTLPIIHAGSARLIPSTLVVSEQQHKPDLAKSALPAMNLLREQMVRMSSSSSMSNLLSDGADRRSKFEISAAIEYFSAVNAAAMRLFFKPWRELLVVSAKRAFQGELSTADWGEAAQRMRENCLKREVPIEVLEDGIDFEQAMVDLPLGLGNKAAKEAIYAKGAELLPYMDDTGRKRFAGSRGMDLFGEEKARWFLPIDTTERPPIDKKIAEMENNMLSAGMPINPDSGEDFMVHLRVHIGWLWEHAQAVDEGHIELVDAVQKMKPVYDHATETFSTAQVPDESNAELNEVKQSLQQLAEIIENGLKALQKLQRQQQEEQAKDQAEQQMAGQESQASVDESKNIKAQADAQIKLQMAELDRQIKTQEHELKQAIVQQKAESDQILAQMKAAQERNLEDLKVASSLRRSDA